MLYLRNNLFFSKSVLHESYRKAAQKLKFSIKDFFSKCDQIRSLLRIWSHLLRKSLIENFIIVHGKSWI